MTEKNNYDKFIEEAKKELKENEIPSPDRIYELKQYIHGKHKITEWCDAGPSGPNNKRFFVGEVTLISREQGPQFKVEFIIKADSIEEASSKFPAYMTVASERILKGDRIQIIKPTSRQVKEILGAKT